MGSDIMSVNIFTILFIAGGCFVVVLLFLLCYFLLSQCINASPDKDRYDCEKARYQPPGPRPPSIHYSEVLNERSRYPPPGGVSVLPTRGVPGLPTLGIPRLSARELPVLPQHITRHHTQDTSTTFNTNVTTTFTNPDTDTTPVKVPKPALKKHIYPDCTNAREAEQFSVERNRIDPTEMNTVFRVNPQDFHYDLLHGKEVVISNDSKVQYWKCKKISQHKFKTVESGRMQAIFQRKDGHLLSKEGRRKKTKNTRH